MTATLKITILQEPSSATANITLGTDGSIDLQAGTAAAPSLSVASDTNTGLFFPAADTVAVSTGGSERMRIASDGSLSAVVTGGSTLYPSFTARAWVNFNGEGTASIRASGNVSSLTDHGTGDYTVNFTTSMPDVNYSWASGVGNALESDNNDYMVGLKNGSTPATGSIRISISRTAATGLIDPLYACLSIFR